MSKKRRNCELCDKSFGSKQILSHYKACIAENYKEYAGHYVVSFFSHDEDNNFYYMYAIVNPETTFATIDKFLRNKWLACCGHASTFECENKIRFQIKIFLVHMLIKKYCMSMTWARRQLFTS